MVHKHSTVLEAYSVLGLEQGASLEIVKSTYKQLALKTHPDKNPGDEDATAQFQRLSEAYNVLLKTLDRSSSPPLRPTYSHSHSHPHTHTHAHGHSHSHSHYHPFASFDYDDIDEFDEYDEYDDDYYDDYDDYDDYEEDLDFYRFLFEEVLLGHASRHAHAHYRFSAREAEPHESPEEYAARLRRAREQQEQAEERRAREEAYRKAEQQRERERVRREAEERQRQKASAKKAEAEASRKTAEQKARAKLQQLQATRSKVFATARRKDFAAVKKSVWEDNVDAAGGELRTGAEAFVKNKPADPKETLLHIAAKNGDTDMIQWLGSHGADAEERDSQDMTAFHVALTNKHPAVVLHFFENHPPDDEDCEAIYRAPEGKSNLGLALESREPEIVWMILDKRLHTKEEMDEAWAALNAPAFKSSVSPQSKFDELVNLFATFGNYTPVAPVEEPTPEPAPQTQAGSAGSERKAQEQRQRGGKPPCRLRPTVKVEEARSSTASPTSSGPPQTPQTPFSASASPDAPRPYRGRGGRGRPFQPRPQNQQQKPSGSQPSSPDTAREAPYVPQGADVPQADGQSRGPRQQQPGFGGHGRGRGRGQFRGRGRGRGRGQGPVAGSA
ncbi:hypothetical protein PYCCODRAFT_484974 [Trametes coccinea BRFM310]|uniref:J domain-containing protein n=1 Tax=Trametes coccinea (strain BRFM310) TaxID=1353009 RepID=A0A1Y2IK88_TRAC3|nr:hypothetical protein PYCCODRAFT_484974 [Trametes coccinea BRFM310]